MRQWQRTTAAAGLGFDGGVVATMGMRSYAGNRGRPSEFIRCSHGKRKGKREKEMKKEERKKGKKKGKDKKEKEKMKVRKYIVIKRRYIIYF
jgi:hypothetical protein